VSHGSEGARLRQRYVYTDDLKPEIEARTADLPLGTGLVFPRLKQAGGRYLREWVYPERFEDQPKFAYELLSEGRVWPRCVPGAQCGSSGCPPVLSLGADSAGDSLATSKSQGTRFEGRFSPDLA
jgi:hypothetical protein